MSKPRDGMGAVTFAGSIGGGPISYGAICYVGGTGVRVVGHQARRQALLELHRMLATALNEVADEMAAEYEHERNGSR